jgi:hypothetical protein
MAACDLAVALPSWPAIAARTRFSDAGLWDGAGIVAACNFAVALPSWLAIAAAIIMFFTEFFIFHPFPEPPTYAGLALVHRMICII